MVVTLVNKSGAKQQGPRDSFITLLAQPEAEVSWCQFGQHTQLYISKPAWIRFLTLKRCTRLVRRTGRALVPVSAGCMVVALLGVGADDRAR